MHELVGRLFEGKAAEMRTGIVTGFDVFSVVEDHSEFLKFERTKQKIKLNEVGNDYDT